jgi:Flavin-binding monooxygenase-like
MTNRTDTRPSNWRWPDIPGLRTFKGTLLHSAAWNTSTDLKGKNVAVLGCGSSGVQIVPTIQPGKLLRIPSLAMNCLTRYSDVKHLTTFIRSPTWITAGFAQNKAGPNGSNFACECNVHTLPVHANFPL